MKKEHNHLTCKDKECKWHFPEEEKKCVAEDHDYCKIKHSPQQNKEEKKCKKCGLFNGKHQKHCKPTP